MYFSGNNNNKDIPLLLVSSFLLIGLLHFACRGDVTFFDDMLSFQSVSAKAVVSSEPVQTAVQTENSTDTSSIIRNPFLMPSAALPPAQSPAPNYPGFPGGTAAVSAPFHPPEPNLKGIISQGNRRMAIIEYSGKSSYYLPGQTIGNYTIDEINASSVLLDGPEQLNLTVGDNTR